MKRALLIVMVTMIVCVNGYARTNPGSYALAAPLSDWSSAEIAFSKMANEKTMYLIDLMINYSNSKQEVEVNGTKSDGPEYDDIGFELAPELRTYFRPSAKASPYMGIFVLGRYGHDKSTTTSATTTSEATNTIVRFGGGLTLGVEYFMNKVISISAHTRFVNFTYQKATEESGTWKETVSTMGLRLFVEPALYVRIYF